MSLGADVLTDVVKRQLKAVVLDLRHQLEDDLARQLRRLGLDTGTGRHESADRLPYLSPEDVTVRETLDVLLAKEIQKTGDGASAAQALLRESAYTHLNRLVGLKCLETRGHLVVDGEVTETITTRSEYGGRPQWLWRLRERDVRYRRGEDAEALLWLDGLKAALRAVAPELGLLFDPEDPYTCIWPSWHTLSGVVKALNALPESAFRSDELLGWVYQYFQSEEKEKVFAAVKQSKLKIGWPDLIPATQLYTERYMVEFLLHNSLGRRWMEMYRDSPVCASWRFYCPPESAVSRAPTPLRDWTVLDPCMGSGHFLVVAFDMLVQLYGEEQRMAEEGRIPRNWAIPATQIARTILDRNLFGIDIDPRAVQIAALALYLKAREIGLDELGGPPRLHVVVADAVFPRGHALDALLGLCDADTQQALKATGRALEQIRELGSLVRLESAVQSIGARPGRPVQLGLAQERETELLQRVRAALTTSAVGEKEVRLFGMEAVKGANLLDLLERRYDVVCTNPPYMGSQNMSAVLKNFLNRNYKVAARELFAAFILRNLELSKPDGHVAMVTRQTWILQSSFARLRAMSPGNERSGNDGVPGLLIQSTLEALAHLGPGAFSEIGGHVVNVVLFTLRNSSPPSGHRVLAFRLVGAQRPHEKAQRLVNQVGVREAAGRYYPVQASFLAIPGAPICYWFGETFLNLLAGRVLRDSSVLADPTTTGDNERFFRAFWEVRPGERWRYACRGGGYSRWDGLKHWVLDWGDDGRVLKSYGGASLMNEKWMFRTGLTYTEAASGSLSVRILAEDETFAKSGPGLFPREKLYGHAAILNSRVTSYLLRAFARTFMFSLGSIGGVPVPAIVGDDLESLGKLATELKQCELEASPTERRFQDVALLPGDSPFDWRTENCMAIQAVRHTVEGLIERIVFDKLGVAGTDAAAVLAETGSPCGWHPIVAGSSTLPPIQMALDGLGELAIRLETFPTVSQSTEKRASLLALLKGLYESGPGATQPETDGITRGTHDEDDEESEAPHTAIPNESFLEELSNKVGIHPISIWWLLKELRAQGVVCPSELRRHAEDFVSVLVLRLLGFAWPSGVENAEMSSQWIEPDGVLVLSSPGGGEGVVDRLRRFLDARYGAERGPAIEAAAVSCLGWKRGEPWGRHRSTTLERWLQREFFKRHVSQFKKRPVVWHLASPAGFFQVLVFYPVFDGNRLALLRSRHLRLAVEAVQRQLGDALSASKSSLGEVARLEDVVADLIAFDASLQAIQEGKLKEARLWCPWKGAPEQPRGWAPDVSDGVRVNIAPMQRLKLLAAEVLSKQDLHTLLAPEGR